MKKLLLGTAAIAMGLALSAPAQAADGVKLELGGHFKGYLFYANQDDVLAAGAGETRAIDAVRESEIHFTGETTLDNGLTVGAHFELNADGNNVDGTGAGQGFEESYAYFSGAWGRINFGAEDGAAYLLQVAAPSADSNYDGIRQYVSPFNYTPAVVGATLASVANFGGLAPAGPVPVTAATAATTIGSVTHFAQRFDYDNNATGYKEKLTYLTPVLNGFQAGISYTPELGLDAGYIGSHGTNLDDQNNEYGSSYEGALRYEGQIQELGIAVGAGYSYVDLEKEGVPLLDDHVQWNLGADLDYGPFGVGIVYLEDNQGQDNGADRETWVLGADYTTGPFKLGASYYYNKEEVDNITGTAGTDIETNRYTAGVVYTYGPGMTFRGTVTYVNHDLPVTAARGDIDGTALMLGTQINF